MLGYVIIIYVDRNSWHFYKPRHLFPKIHVTMSTESDINQSAQLQMLARSVNGQIYYTCKAGNNKPRANETVLSNFCVLLLFPLKLFLDLAHTSRVVRKPAFCICENKDADQLRGSREADQRLLFSLYG